MTAVKLSDLWHVGYHTDPLGFTPRELYAFSHRFDDASHRFRTLYCAESPETCLRECSPTSGPILLQWRGMAEASKAATDRTENSTLLVEILLV